MATATSRPPAPMAIWPKAAAGGGVAVGAEQRGARLAEALQMDLVADAVARPREDDAVALAATALKVAVVVVVLKADLERVVVNVGDREVGLDPVRPRASNWRKAMVRWRPG